MDKIVTLQPLKTGRASFEMILTTVDDYPSFLMHVDTLWEKGPIRSEIYERLVKGETLQVKMTLEIVKSKEVINGQNEPK